MDANERTLEHDIDKTSTYAGPALCRFKETCRGLDKNFDMGAKVTRAQHDLKLWAVGRIDSPASS